MLRSQVRRSGPGTTQAGHQWSHDSIATVLGSHNLDFDLPESGCYAPAVPHRHLVVNHLRQAAAGSIEQPDATANCRQAGDGDQLGVADVGANDGHGRRRWFLCASLEGELITFEKRLALAVGGGSGRWQLQRPPLARPVAQRNSPSREPQICSIEVDSFESDRFGRGDRDSVDDPGQVGEVERRSSPELYLTLEHSGRRAPPRCRERSPAQAPGSACVS